MKYRFQSWISLDPGSDPAALGGAVTVALCGHWDHPGACRWPHRNESLEEDGRIRFQCWFDAPEEEVGEVRQRIEDALRAGRLVGPDQRISTWKLHEVNITLVAR